MAYRQAEQAETRAVVNPLSDVAGVNDNRRASSPSLGPLRFALCLTLGLAFGLSSAAYVIRHQPDRFAASSQIYVETGLSPESIPADAAMKAAARKLQSPDFLAPVVDVLHLSARQVSATSPAAKSATAALKILQGGLAVQSDPASQIMTVSFTGPSASQSAQIVNEIVSRLSADFEARRNPAQAGSASVDAARLDLLQAQSALQDFQLGQTVVDPTAGSDLSSQLATQSARVADLEAAARQMKTVSLKDLVSGALPPFIETVRLQQLRDAYAAANRTFQTLSVNLGPRHPQLLAAITTRDQAVEDIRTELKSIARTVSADLKAARAELKALTEQEDPLSKDMTAVADQSARLQALKQAVDDKRQTFEAARAAMVTASRSSVAQALRLRIISRAFPADVPVGMPKTLQWLLFGLAGAGLGLCLATLLRPTRRPRVTRLEEPELPDVAVERLMPEPEIAPVVLPAIAQCPALVSSLLSVLEEQQRDEQERLQREEDLRERLRRLVMLTEQVAGQTTYKPPVAPQPVHASIDAIRADFQNLKRRLSAARQA